MIRMNARLTRPLLLMPLLLMTGWATALAEDKRPNILVIMTDDQSHDTLTDQFMPFTKALIADQGITFTRGFMSTPLCAPSRSSFLTGKYARHHGVHNNGDKLLQTTVADRLHDAGYYTGLVGKYLNSWPCDFRSEYDFWRCWKAGYVDPLMNIQGEFVNVPGYLTYINRDQALEFLGEVPDGQPFFLLLTPHAPHAPATPAPGDEDLYADLDLWRPPSFNPDSQPDKPQWLQDLPPLTPDEISSEVDTFRLDQLRCLHSVDLMIRDVLNELNDEGKLDNTFIVFYSDNGYFWGEHRLLRKNRVYEEASHGPFALRYPPLVLAPRVEDRLIQVTDLAPTIYDLAQMPMPDDVDGASLVPLMQGTDQWRDGLLLEGWPGAAGREHYQALRTERYVYVETDADLPELYDLEADPYQLSNIVSDPNYADIVADLRDRLHQIDSGEATGAGVGLSDASSSRAVESSSRGSHAGPAGRGAVPVRRDARR
jgi:arylsulfatase A-like enzyme